MYDKVQKSKLEKALKEIDKQLKELSKIHPIDEEFVKRNMDKLTAERNRITKILRI